MVKKIVKAKSTKFARHAKKYASSVSKEAQEVLMKFADKKFREAEMAVHKKIREILKKNRK